MKSIIPNEGNLKSNKISGEEIFHSMEVGTQLAGNKTAPSMAPLVWEAMSQMEPYRLMNVGDISRISGELDLMFLTTMVVQRNKLKPTIALNGADLGLKAANGASPGYFALRDLQRRLGSTLERWPRHTNAPFVVGYEQRAHAPGNIRASIRLHGPNSV